VNLEKSDDLAWVKITDVQHSTANKRSNAARHSGGRAKPAGSQSSPAFTGCFGQRDSVAQKITDVSRAPKTILKKSLLPAFKITNSKGRPMRRASLSRTFKITEAGRGPNAWQNARSVIHAGSVDKAKSFGGSGRG